MQLEKINHYILICFVFGLLLLFGSVTHASESSFSRTLKIGMSGEDVRILQQILNRNVDTKVTYSGIGSSGQESTYFGSLTQSAVIRFQEKYRQQILQPNGLLSGTGVVGPSTRNVLSSIQNGLDSSKISTSSVNATNSSKNNLNPNLNNLGVFIDALDKVSKKQGISAEKLALIKKQIVLDRATSTDFQKEFVKFVETNTKTFPQNTLIKPSAITAINNFFNFIKYGITPKKAIAGTGTPFGGAVLFSYFCTCSGNWLITLEPLPPTFVTLLTYTIGSQAYLSYNIPFTPWLLGEYTPGAGICESYIGVGCATVPSEGLINPMVGSS